MTIEFQQNAIGVRIEAAFVAPDPVTGELKPLDLTSAQTIILRFSTPGGRSKEFPATIVNSPGTDGLAEMFTTDGHLVPFGDWDIQGLVTFSGGDDLPSKSVAFVVKRNIKEPTP